MHKFIATTFAWWVALLIVAPIGTHAQWRMVAPKLASVGTANGACCFNSGVLWVASNALYMSPDSGMTWVSKRLPDPNSILDLEFYSPTEGVVSNHNGLWVTHDAGNSWQMLIPTYTASAEILDAAGDIARVGEAPSEGVTTNGGQSWGGIPLQSFAFCVQYKAGMLYEFGGSTGGASLFSSTNLGATWQQGAAGIDWDSFSFAVDSCDADRIYLSHEDFYGQTDAFSKIFLSTDRGNSWQTMISRPEPFFSGSVAEGNAAIYCQSVADGIYRSTDRGMNWATIGGPSAPADTRLIAALSDNIIIAADANGNIWRTDNSGGDSLNYSGVGISRVSLSEPPLFARDTIHCNNLTRTYGFIWGGCSHRSVTSYFIVGADSASFGVSNLSPDSISVTLLSTRGGPKRAQLVLNLDNGSSDTIALAGYENIPANTLKVLQPSLFTGDTVFCDSFSRAVLFSSSGCSPPAVTSWSITGSDSANFSASHPNPDSLLVTLYKRSQGAQQAQLVLFLTDGTSDTVALGGYVNTQPYPLNLVTQNVQTDILGGTVSVPITINGLARAENVDLVLRYDGTVDYTGSFSPSGVRLDLPGQQWKGRSELSISGAKENSIAGYAVFNVFNDSNRDSHAIFDSVGIPSALSCQYIWPDPVSSTMTTLSGCGITMLSQFVHLGALPVFGISPNPANGTAWISSSEDAGPVIIEIFDMLGNEESVVSGEMTKENPMELLLPARSGVYNIMIRSIAGTRTLRVVRVN